MAKPYSPSHIGAVAQSFTDMRLSGAVKQLLVDVLISELDQLVPQLESETISQDPERKTLGDPNRTRLGYSRTRELMVDRIDQIDSVGSAAVQRAVEELENVLKKIIQRSEEYAEKDRVGTIKPRHLEQVLAGMSSQNNVGEGTDGESVIESESNTNGQIGADEEDGLADAMGGGQVLTPQTLRRMAKTFAGMPVTDEALEELLLLYYDVVEETEHTLRTSFVSDNPEPFIEKMSQMQDLMRLGWMRRMLRRSAAYATESGYKRVDIEQVVNLEPFE